MRSILIALISVFIFSGCVSEEEAQDYYNKFSDFNTTSEQNSSKKYVFKDYFFTSMDLNKSYDAYTVNEDGNITATYLNDYVMMHYDNKIKDYGWLEYSYFTSSIFFIEVNSENQMTTYLNKYSIDDKVANYCVLESYEESITVFSNYTYSDVLVLRCEFGKIVSRIGYKKLYGKVFSVNENTYSNDKDIRVWNGN